MVIKSAAKAKFIIYGLIDPITLLIRYVGKSVSGLARPRGHRYPSNLKQSTHCTRWIKGLINQGLDYSIVIIEVFSSAQVLADSECWWIAYGRALGWPLTNLTEGGEGTRGRIVSAETRQRLSVAAKNGFASSPERRERLRNAVKSIPAVTRIRVGEAHKEWWVKKRGPKPTTEEWKSIKRTYDHERYIANRDKLRKQRLEQRDIMRLRDREYYLNNRAKISARRRARSSR